MCCCWRTSGNGLACFGVLGVAIAVLVLASPALVDVVLAAAALALSLLPLPLLLKSRVPPQLQTLLMLLLVLVLLRSQLLSLLPLPLSLLLPGSPCLFWMLCGKLCALLGLIAPASQVALVLCAHVYTRDSVFTLWAKAEREYLPSRRSH